MDKIDPVYKKSISKSKINNSLLKNKSITHNLESTICNTNANNMLNSSSHSNSNSNFMHNKNSNVNSFSTNAVYNKISSNSESAANSNIIKSNLVFKGNFNSAAQVSKKNSKDKFGPINQNKNLISCNNKNDLFRSESNLGYQEHESTENKVYMKTENSNLNSAANYPNINNINSQSNSNYRHTNFTAFNSAFNPKATNLPSHTNASGKITDFLKNRVERKQVINNSIGSNYNPNNSINFQRNNIRKMPNNTSLLEYSSSNNIIYNNFNNSNLNNTYNNNALNLTTNKDMINSSISANFNNLFESKKTKNEIINNINSNNNNHNKNNISLNFNNSSDQNLIINFKNNYNYINSNSKSKLIKEKTSSSNNKKPALISLLKTDSSMQIGNNSVKEAEVLSRNKNKNINFINKNNSVSSSQALLNFFNKKPSGYNLNKNDVNIACSSSSTGKNTKK